MLLTSGPRPVTDADADALVTLIGAAYAEYPGCVLDLDDLDRDLLAPATTAAQRGGRWWVVEDEGRVVASVGAGALRPDGGCELKRLYVAASHRRRGLARALVARVEAHAAALGADTVDLWSDTRFADAHRLYGGLGYERTGETRDLHDPSGTTEYRFVHPIAPRRPRRTVTWHGPGGADTCHLVDLPDGLLLHGEIADGTTYRVELDASFATRVVEVVDAVGYRRLTADGHGRWWRDGARVPDLDGCLDVDVEATPATHLLPVRRLGLAVDETASVPVARVRVPGPAVERLAQRYHRTGRDRFVAASGTAEVQLRVDDDGLPVADGPRWDRARG